jgi:hypothetical protein
VDRKKERHCERRQSVLEQNVTFEQHHHHTSYPKNISECEALSEPQLHSIHNFLLINAITANCRMSNPWHTSDSNSVLWLHIWPCQSCTYERFRVQVDRQDWGQSTVSILRARPAPHIKTCYFPHLKHQNQAKRQRSRSVSKNRVRIQGSGLSTKFIPNLHAKW